MDAQAHGYAVGAFNVEDMEMIQAVIAAAEAEQATRISAAQKWAEELQSGIHRL